MLSMYLRVWSEATNEFLKETYITDRARCADSESVFLFSKTTLTKKLGPDLGEKIKVSDLVHFWVVGRADH